MPSSLINVRKMKVVLLRLLSPLANSELATVAWLQRQRKRGFCEVGIEGKVL